jgi:hypothetical protein
MSGGNVVIRITVEYFDIFLLQPLGFGVLRFVTGKNNRVHVGRRDLEIILQRFDTVSVLVWLRPVTK